MQEKKIKFCKKCFSGDVEWMGEDGLDIGLMPYKCGKCGHIGATGKATEKKLRELKRKGKVKKND